MASPVRVQGSRISDRDCFLLTQIQAEPLALRLLQQLLSAASDFANDPRGFVREIFAPNDRDRKRKQLLYGGFALGVVIYGALLTLVLVVGLFYYGEIGRGAPRLILAFAALLFGLYRLRMRQLRERFALTLETRVAERTRIARELHDTLLQSFHGLLLRFQTAFELLPARPAQATHPPPPRGTPRWSDTSGGRCS